MATDTGAAAGAAGAAGAAAAFDGQLTGWPEEGSININNTPNTSLNICSIPTDQKAFIRYYACEWMKNQPVGNIRQQAQQAIQSAQTLYGELSMRGYMDN